MRIKNRDIVVWCGAHFTHIVTEDDDGVSSNGTETAGHIVGPDLIPLELA